MNVIHTHTPGSQLAAHFQVHPSRRHETARENCAILSFSLYSTRLPTAAATEKKLIKRRRIIITISYINVFAPNPWWHPCTPCPVGRGRDGSLAGFYWPTIITYHHPLPFYLWAAPLEDDHHQTLVGKEKGWKFRYILLRKQRCMYINE